MSEPGFLQAVDQREKWHKANADGNMIIRKDFPDPEFSLIIAIKNGKEVAVEFIETMFSVAMPQDQWFERYAKPIRDGMVTGFIVPIQHKRVAEMAASNVQRLAGVKPYVMVYDSKGRVIG